jgi:hypothetical protein
VIVSASSLVRDCGYQRALRRARTPSASQQASMDRGTVFHQAVEQWARTRELPVLPDLEMQGWLDLLAAEWAPPVDGEFEVAWGAPSTGDPFIRQYVTAVWCAYVEVHEPEPHVYVARDGGPLLTAGRADVAWWYDGHLRVVDWKTGKWPTTPAVDNLQVNAAGIALALKRGLLSYVPGVYYARDGFWDWGEPVVFGTPAFERILGEIRAAALLDETPRPGAHCGKCWEKRGCAHAQTAVYSPGP